MKILPGQTKKRSQEVNLMNASGVPPVAMEMKDLCQLPLGRKSYAMALAHCQVDHDSPLRFFVMKDGTLIMNPQILETKGGFWHTEGCMSFPFRNDRKVWRAQEVRVKYIDENAREQNRWVDGIEACIFQHEIDHMNGIDIYSKK